MSRLVPWSRFIKRRQLNVSSLLNRFNNYQEFSQWFIRMGGSPPPLEEVSQYFDADDIDIAEPLVGQNEVPIEESLKPTVSMKNTKVQLLAYAASHNVVVSYYDNKKTILTKMKRSGKFTILFSKSKK